MCVYGNLMLGNVTQDKNGKMNISKSDKYCDIGECLKDRRMNLFANWVTKNRKKVLEQFL